MGYTMVNMFFNISQSRDDVLRSPGTKNKKYFFIFSDFSKFGGNLPKIIRSKFIADHQNIAFDDLRSTTVGNMSLTVWNILVGAFMCFKMFLKKCLPDM